MVHIGALKDFLDLVTDIKSSASELGFGDKRYSSISKRASEGTLQFPHIISRNIDIDTAQTLCKGSESLSWSIISICQKLLPPFIRFNLVVCFFRY